jgi:hypothetical protein
MAQSDETIEARPDETVDEFYHRILLDMIFTLRRLRFGYYKRDYAGAASESGYLLPTGERQALGLLLDHLAKPPAKGRPRLTYGSIMNRWGRDKAEFEQERKAFELQTGNKRASRRAAIEAMGVKWNMTPEAAKKRIAGIRPIRGRTWDSK